MFGVEIERHYIRCHAPRRRGIQYAAASVATARYPTHASGILDRPVKPGDDSGGCGCDVD
ncbi:hypothetical protein CWO91_34150 [Bradyrhizobium genosp. SA-3]|nr:hypothetical protein CWO91_34150 [Bradyrhizobium genosp. SA-3]